MMYLALILSYNKPGGSNTRFLLELRVLNND